MNRLERLYAITETIRRSAPRPVSAGSLAHTFGVTRRTIERDLNSLRDAGVPLYSERGRAGGHVALDQTGNTMLVLTAAEVSSLLIALAAAGPHMPFNDAGVSAANRLLDSLGPTSQVAVQQLRDCIRVRDQPRASARARRTVEEALRRSVVVNIDYTDADHAKTTRAVDPIGFYSGGDGWYLIGWCHLRKERRLFRLDRIRGARLTTKRFRKRDVDDVLGWVPDQVTTP